jgi:acyl carrier protein
MQDDGRVIFDTVATILEDCMDIPKSSIKSSSRLVDDLGLDSIGGLELLSALQGKYNIFVDRSQLKYITTVNEIVMFIHERIYGQG